MSKFTSDFYFNMADKDITYIDIRTRQPATSTLPLTIDTFKQKVKTYKYRKIYSNHDKNDTTENLRCIPFSYHFYQLLAKKGMPPSPNEYVHTYLSSYLIYDDKKHNIGHFRPELQKYTFSGPIIIEPLKNRILRAYTAYMRELDTYLYLTNSLTERGYQIIYNYELDAHHGIDILIKREEFQIGIASYIKTTKACEWYTKKNHDDSITIIPFYGILNVAETNIDQTQEIFLYTDQAKKKLTKSITKAFKNYKQQ